MNAIYLKVGAGGDFYPTKQKGITYLTSQYLILYTYINYRILICR